MTRKSERELERNLARLTDRDRREAGPMILYENPETGDAQTPEGDVVDPDEFGEAALTQHRRCARPMTRRSERELERAVEDLDSGPTPRSLTLVEFLSADTVEPMSG